MSIESTDVIELKKIIIEKRFYKINALAKASGVTCMTLRSILHGKSQPSYAVMKKLITTLDIPAAKAGEIFFKTNLHNSQ